MKTTKILLCVALATLVLQSCRQEDNYIPSYAGADALTMGTAGESFGNEFDALWTAVNSNYVAWEIETVNWDEVYDTYKPKFVELDTLMAHGQTITDADFTSLYKEVLDTLHDGHCMYEIKNLSTGKYALVRPQADRNMRRFGANASVVVPYDLSYYASTNIDAKKRFSTPVYGITSCYEYIQACIEQGSRNLQTAYSKATTAEERATIVEEQKQLASLKDNIQNLLTKNNLVEPYQIIQAEDLIITSYNSVAANLFDARMPQYATSISAATKIEVLSAVSADGIAYLRFSGFYLNKYLKPTEEEIQKMAQTNYFDYLMYLNIRNAWHNWVDNIQTLANNGALKGVIIDVRGNGGGNNDDQQYTVGALLPSGGFKTGTYKTKIGTGRLDYSVDMDFIYKTYPDDHAVVSDKPIVILCDHNSVSNSELAAIAVKQQPNGIVVGSQTHGGMSCLGTGQNAYSITYSGEFGVRNSTAIYGYQPLSLISYTGYGPLEGIGVTPTVNLEYDKNLYTTQKRDNQLEAALKAIRGE